MCNNRFMFILSPKMTRFVALNLVDIYKIEDLKQTKPFAESVMTFINKHTNAYICTTVRTCLCEYSVNAH